MVQYYTLGAEKRLNEIVMAGSHDAGITKGGGNAMTQKLDILGQANAGVRIFDLRVSGVGPKVFGKDEVKLKTYHGPLLKSTVHNNVAGLSGKQDVVQAKVMGTFGEGLVKILIDAKYFVETNPTEFLILKFDKCNNWKQIAELCVQVLGTTLYRGAGNLNKKTLFDLKGTVIVVFTQKGLLEIDERYHGAGGILGIKSLGAGDTYQKVFDGLQYVGKGGTNPMTSKGKSMQENIDKQLDRLKQGGSPGNENVMGMMYWTTTGIVGDIRKRNKAMWRTPQHLWELEDLWKGGMGAAVKARMPACMDPTSFAGGTVLKRFLPNFVMIDFASARKCQTIFMLNKIIPLELTKMEKQMIELRKPY